MKKKQFILCGSYLAGFLMLASCGGGKGAITTKSAPNVVSTFKTVLDQLPKGNGKTTTAISLSSKKVSPNNEVSNDSNGLFGTDLACYTSTPTSPTDKDGDGVPLLKEYAFDCSDFVSGSNSYNRKGSFKIIDKDDAVAGTKGGYRYEYSIPSWYYTDTSSKLTSGGSYRGFWDTEGSDTTSRFNSDFSGRSYGEYDVKNYGIMKTDYEYSYKWDITYTHNQVNAQGQWTSGSMVGKGSFVISGKFLNEKEESPGKVSFESVDGTAAMTWEAIDVTFDSTCTKWFKSGLHRLTDFNGNIIEIRFNCTEAKVYLNNKEQTEVVW